MRSILQKTLRKTSKIRATSQLQSPHRYFPSQKSPMSSSSSTPSQLGNETPSPPQEQEQVRPALPPLPSPTSGDEVTKLDVNGGGVSLDHLGPMVVNEDGTMSRIANWGEMSEIEKDNTLRILGARNRMRLKKLREAQQQQQDGTGNSQ